MSSIPYPLSFRGQCIVCLLCCSSKLDHSHDHSLDQSLDQSLDHSLDRSLPPFPPHPLALSAQSAPSLSVKHDSNDFNNRELPQFLRLSKSVGAQCTTHASSLHNLLHNLLQGASTSSSVSAKASARCLLAHAS